MPVMIRWQRQAILYLNLCSMGSQCSCLRVSNLVFYAQSTITVIILRAKLLEKRFGVFCCTRFNRFTATMSLENDQYKREI